MGGLPAAYLWLPTTGSWSGEYVANVVEADSWQVMMRIKCRTESSTSFTERQTEREPCWRAGKGRPALTSSFHRITTNFELGCATSAFCRCNSSVLLSWRRDPSTHFPAGRSCRANQTAFYRSSSVYFLRFFDSRPLPVRWRARRCYSQPQSLRPLELCGPHSAPTVRARAMYSILAWVSR